MDQTFHTGICTNILLKHRYTEYLLIDNDKMDDAANWELSPLKTNIHAILDIPDNDYRLNYDVSIFSIAVPLVFSLPTPRQKKIHLKSPFFIILLSF